MSVDITYGLKAFLLANEALTDLVSERVFGLELPDSQASIMPIKSVVISPSGGPPLTGGYAAVTAQTFDMFSYGENPYECQRVRSVVFDALKALRREVSVGVLIHWCEPAGGFANMRDPDTKWPINFQSFQAFYAETAAV
ncbi:hypothetical protein LCGC14_1405360 [marine sediment metagenome]|uniref:DUF3168 domain-containing protein n=1 Tax=marine sediment metagenome TaxID=412755 RepID=A0A0F9KGT2_9ZZZZ